MPALRRFKKAVQAIVAEVTGGKKDPRPPPSAPRLNARRRWFAREGNKRLIWRDMPDKVSADGRCRKTVLEVGFAG